MTNKLRIADMIKVMLVVSDGGYFIISDEGVKKITNHVCETCGKPTDE